MLVVVNDCQEFFKFAFYLLNFLLDLYLLIKKIMSAIKVITGATGMVGKGTCIVSQD